MSGRLSGNGSRGTARLELLRFPRFPKTRDNAVVQVAHELADANVLGRNNQSASPASQRAAGRSDGGWAKALSG